MNNLLVYHGKHSDHYWLIDTPARHDAAMVALFNLMDEYGYYRNLGARNNAILSAARGGDLKYIKHLLNACASHEYQSWEIETAKDATEG